MSTWFYGSVSIIFGIQWFGGTISCNQVLYFLQLLPLAGAMVKSFPISTLYYGKYAERLMNSFKYNTCFSLIKLGTH